MALTDQDVLAALKKIPYPGFTRDIVSAGAIRNVVVDQAHVRLEVVPGPGDPAVARQIREQARAAVETLPGVASVEIMLAGTPTSSSAQANPSSPRHRSRLRPRLFSRSPPWSGIFCIPMSRGIGLQ